jgi:hypothetical protein
MQAGPCGGGLHNSCRGISLSRIVQQQANICLDRKGLERKNSHTEEGRAALIITGIHWWKRARWWCNTLGTASWH